MQEWKESGGAYTERNASAEGMTRLAELHASAYVDMEDFSLEPGEGAVLPVKWDRPLPSKLAYIAEVEGSAAEVTPGVVDLNTAEFVVLVTNTKQESVQLLRGHPIARIYAPPEDMEVVRRDFHPETGAMPEVLKTWNGGIFDVPYISSSEQVLKNIEQSSIESD